MTKKKIIFINNHFQYSDGTVNALIRLVNNLDREKYDVTILPLYRLDKRRKAELNEGITLKKGFGFYFRGFSSIVRKLPISWLYKKFIGGKYDIEVAFQCDMPTILVGNSKNAKATHVAWMHGYQLHADCFANCDKVVCVSKHNALRAKAEMGETPVDITYRYNLIEDAAILQKSQEEIPFKKGEAPLLVTVGRLSPEKGYVRLVKILGELKKEGFAFHLLLVGEGSERAAIEEEIGKWDLSTFVTMTGEQVNPYKYVAKADLFICSSFDEGYSTVCNEAAILGIPVLTTAVSGGQEIIEECECGKVTAIEDEGLKEGIREILVRPEQLIEWKKTMAKTAQKFALAPRKAAMNELFDELYRLSDKKQGKDKA